MSWLSDRLKEAQAQLNVFDGGKTAQTVRASRNVQPAQTVKQQQVQQVQNSPYISQARKQSVIGGLNAPKTRFNPLTSTSRSFGEAVNTTARGLGGAVVNTAQLNYDAGRLASAKVTGNKPAEQNARKAFSSDANNNMLWNEGFNRTSNILSGAVMGNRQADASRKANENYANTIKNAYIKKGADPRQVQAWADSNIAANTQSDQAEQLSRYGLTPTTSLVETSKKVGLPIASTGAQIALNAVGGGAGAKVGTQLVKSTARESINKVGKQALGFGTANAGIATADTLSAGGSAKDAAQAGMLGLVTGAAFPVAGAVGSVGARATTKLVNKATSRKPIPEPLMQQRVDLLGQRSIAETKNPRVIPYLDREIAKVDEQIQQATRPLIAPLGNTQGGFVANPFYKDPKAQAFENIVSRQKDLMSKTGSKFTAKEAGDIETANQLNASLKESGNEILKGDFPAKSIPTVEAQGPKGAPIEKTPPVKNAERYSIANSYIGFGSDANGKFITYKPDGSGTNGKNISYDKLSKNTRDELIAAENEVANARANSKGPVPAGTRGPVQIAQEKLDISRSKAIEELGLQDHATVLDSNGQIVKKPFLDRYSDWVEEKYKTGTGNPDERKALAKDMESNPQKYKAQFEAESNAGAIGKDVRPKGAQKTTQMTPDEYLRAAYDNSGVGSGRDGISYDKWLAIQKDGTVADVAKYAENMKNGDVFPALSLNKTNRQQDGVRRALAAQRNGSKQVDVNVIDKTTPVSAPIEKTPDVRPKGAQMTPMQKAIEEQGGLGNISLVQKQKEISNRSAQIAKQQEADRVSQYVLKTTGNPDEAARAYNRIISKGESQATLQGRQTLEQQPRLSQTQPVQSVGGQLDTPPTAIPQKIVTPKPNKVAGSSDPIIPQTQLDGQTTLPLGDVRTFRAKIQEQQSNKQVPVKKVETNGQRVTKTNIKSGKEERFVLGDDGEMRPDSNGAYRIFTNDKGELTEIRIGDEVYSSKDIGDLTKIKNYGSINATQRRNIERAIPDPDTRQKVVSLVVDYQQHQVTKMVERHAALNDGLKTIQKDLGISFGIGRHKAKKVSAAIQDLGEGKRSRQSLVDEYGEAYTQKIENADKWFRNQYDTLLDEMNATLTKYGYEPVPKRKDYYTHFSEPTLFQKFGLKMQEINDAMGTPLQEANPTGGRGSISNALAGQSEYMLPNKKFNQFALQRKGDQRTANAFESFERYLSPTLNNIYMTPAITRGRVMAKAIAMENDRVGQDVNHVVTQLREWTNHLAGKSNRLGDRQAADTKGLRQALQISNWIQRKVGGNSIVGNFATAFIQPIVLAQTAGKAGYKNTLLAISQELSTAHAPNAAIRQSEFLRRRYTNTAPVTRGKSQRGADVAGIPLKVIEETAGRITWQAHYNTALSKGIKGKQAIQFADIEAEKTMAGRALGEKPEFYRSKSAGPITQFALEVNNYIQQVGKEMTPAQVAKTFVAAYALNLVIQQATGRSIGFNPIDAGIDSVQELASDDTSGEKAKKISQRWAGEIVGNIPGASNVIDTFTSDDQVKKFFGNETPIGRYGVGSTYGSIVDNTIGKVMQGKPWEAVAYTAMPWGYSQANKTVKGVKAVLDGEMTDKDGNTTVEVPQTPGNFVRGAIFGPSAIKEVGQYYNNIGVKKADQKPVQNQTNSKAASMGAPDFDSKKDEMKQVKELAKKKFGLTDKSEDEIKDLANNGDQNAIDALDNINTLGRVYKKQSMAQPKGLNGADASYIDKFERLTDKGKEAVFNREKDAEYKLAQAKFNKAKAEGKLSTSEELTQLKALKKDKVGTAFDKQIRDLYGVTEKDLGDYLKTEEKGVDKKKIYDQLIAYDQALKNAGLSSTLKYKNGIANSSTGKSSGGGSKKKSYKLLGFGSPTGTNSSLRKLLEGAVIK